MDVRYVHIATKECIPILKTQFSNSLNYKCPLGFNAAEYYISILGVEVDKEAESRLRIRRICDEYSRSDIAAEIDNRVGNVRDETEYFNGTVNEKVRGKVYFVRLLVSTLRLGKRDAALDRIVCLAFTDAV